MNITCHNCKAVISTADPAFKLQDKLTASKQREEELQAQMARLRVFVKDFRENIGGALWSLSGDELELAKQCESLLSDTSDNDKWLAEVKAETLESLLKRSVEVDTPDGIEWHVPRNVIYADIVILRNQAKKG